MGRMKPEQEEPTDGFWFYFVTFFVAVSVLLATIAYACRGILIS